MDQHQDQPRRLVLASGSRYRKELLGRLGLGFEVVVPNVDETALAGESAPDTALRLSLLKAKALQPTHGDALIIGSDQVAECGGRIYGKPGNYENAVQQLRELSGKAADFHTAVTVLDAASGNHESRLVPCRIVFRPLAIRLIQNYLRKEQPYDCAGAAKAEGLGIALLQRIQTDDPTALIGLPLIALTGMLERAGLPVL